jgi:chromosome segregation ATPase
MSSLMDQNKEDTLSTQENDRYRGASSRRPSPRGGGGMGMTVMLALMVAGLAGAGWFIVNQQQMLLAEQERVNDAGKRLSVLEQRLAATDNAMSQEGQDTKQQINLWESEIRKLWAIANERNRDWIKDNQAQIKSVSASLNGIRASNRDLKAATGRHEEALKIQQQLIDQVTSLELQLQQMLRAQRELVDKANLAARNVAAIQGELSPLVAENTEAVLAFDSYRIGTNRRLVALERELVRLQNSGASSPTPVPSTP